MNQFPFTPQSLLTRAFVYDLKTDADERRLQVFRWEDRLVAHEKASGLWWATLDPVDHRNVWEFWHESVANERIGRLISWERDAKLESNGAILTINRRWHRVHVLVAHDNSGFALVEGASRWCAFRAIKIPPAHKPKAFLPTIWSPGFHTRFARRALKAAYNRSEISHLPVAVGQMETVRSLWPQGKSARPMRLLVAALAFWKMGNLRMNHSMPQFWHEFLQRYSPGDSVRHEDWHQRRQALLKCPEANFPGNLSHYRSPYYNQGRLNVSFAWESEDVTLHIELDPNFNSAHDQLEAKLELRDWLAGYFLPEQVESWLSGSAN